MTLTNGTGMPLHHSEVPRHFSGLEKAKTGLERPAHRTSHQALGFSNSWIHCLDAPICSPCSSSSFSITCSKHVHQHAAGLQILEHSKAMVPEKFCGFPQPQKINWTKFSQSSGPRKLQFGTAWGPQARPEKWASARLFPKSWQNFSSGEKNAKNCSLVANFPWGKFPLGSPEIPKSPATPHHNESAKNSPISGLRDRILALQKTVVSLGVSLGKNSPRVLRKFPSSLGFFARSLVPKSPPFLGLRARILAL